MTRLISLLTLTWTSLVQAIPFPDNFHYYRPTLSQQLPAHAAFQATQLAVNTSLSAVFGERIDRAFKSSAILAAVNTAGGVVSNNIGRAFDANEMNSITHDLVHGINGAIGGAIIDGKDGAVAGAFGAMLSERLAKTLMPTKVDVTETITNAAGEKVQVTKTIRPTYTTERISQVHAIIHFAVGTGAFLTGMDVAQMAVAVNASVIAVEHNHGDTLRRRDDTSVIDEDEVDGEDVDNDLMYDSDHDVDDVPTYDSDNDIEDIGFVDEKGRFIPRKSQHELSSTPKQSTQRNEAKEKDRTISLQVKGREGKAPKLDLKALQEYQGDLRCLTPRSHAAVLEYQSCLAFNAEQPDDVHGLFRPIDEVDTKLSFDPLSRAESAYVNAQSELGSAANEKHQQGETLSDYERTVRRDARRENQRFIRSAAGHVAAFGIGAASLPVAGVVGATCGLSAAGTAAVAGAIGGAAGALDTYASHDYDGSEISGLELGFSAAAGAALSAVPGYKGANTASATKGSITLQNATNIGKSSAYATAAESKVAANSNMPIKPTANLNRMSAPQPQAFEATGTHDIQRLAQNVRGGSSHIAASDIDYRQVYMSSKASTGGSHIGSSKSATQTALDSIAGKSSAGGSHVGSGTLTLDGNGRILSGSKDSGSLRIYPRPVDGNVSVEDLFQRPVGLEEITERTMASYERVKAARSSQQAQSEIKEISKLKTSVADRVPEIDALRAERMSRAEGLAKLKARPDAQTLEISHNVGERTAFNRKMNAFQDLAERNKLVKTETARNPRVTEKYRDALLERAKQQWKHTDPEKYKSMQMRIRNMDADHLHELQLGGLDHSSMLSMLDKSVNRSIGSQIRHQLAKMSEGTRITKVVEKGQNK